MCYKLLAAIFIYKLFICSRIKNLSETVSKFTLCSYRVVSSDCIYRTVIQGNCKICRSVSNKLNFIIVSSNSNTNINCHNIARSIADTIKLYRNIPIINFWEQESL